MTSICLNRRLLSALITYSAYFVSSFPRLPASHASSGSAAELIRPLNLTGLAGRTVAVDASDDEAPAASVWSIKSGIDQAVMVSNYDR